MKLSDLLDSKGIIDTQKLQSIDIQDGLALIEKERVTPLLNYLSTGAHPNMNNVTFMNAYTIIVHFGDQTHHSHQLYCFYKDTIGKYCNAAGDGLVSYRGEELLKRTADKWEKMTILVFWMQRVFQYLDRFFTKNNSDHPDLFLQGLMCFKTGVYDKVKVNLREATIQTIDAERNGNLVDRDVLKRIVEMYCTVGDKEVKIQKVKDDHGERLFWTSKEKGVYKTDLEEPLITATAEYYNQKSALWISEMTCPDYLKEVDKRLKDEVNRLTSYLERSTETSLLAACHKDLIAERASHLVEMDTGCASMFEHRRLDELHLMFTVFKLVPSTLRLITEVMRPYLEKRVAAVVDDKQKQDTPEEYIETLLDLKSEIDNMMLRCFPDETLFEKARNAALEGVLNKETRCVKYLAVFCDFQLKKGLKGKTDAEVATMINRIVSLFTHLKDKDIFLDVYKERLSKRLLAKTSVAKDAEDQVINRLKIEVGQQAVQKLMAMFKDMEVSDKLQEEFNALEHGGSPAGVQMEIKVLQSNSWPAKVDPGVVKLPKEMASCVESFQLFYTNKFSGRKLHWIHNMGQAELAGNCFARRHFLGVSALQAVLLLLFNSETEMTVKQFMDATGIPDAECKRQLLSLTTTAQKILNKDTQGRDLADTTKFSVNTEFTSQKVRVQIQLIKKEDPRETAPAEIPVERKHVIDAVIVRIMKARKQLEHNSLLEEIYKQCTLFRPQPTQIKTQIENLIDREFLSRHAEKRNTYIYMP